VDDAVLFIARLSGGGLASFEATRLATGYHNANRFEIHGEKGALRFDFERMNELGFYDLSADAAVQGWTTIDVTKAGAAIPTSRHGGRTATASATRTPSSTRLLTS
jgi:predicted dehydrogenase